MLRFFVCLPVVAFLASPVAAANFWLSTISNPDIGSAPPSSPGGVPAINHPEGTTNGSIFIWARPDAGKTLANFSLHLISTNPNVLTFTNSFVETFNVLDGQDPNTVRWEQTDEPTGSSVSIVDMRGFSLFGYGTSRFGIGIGPQSTGSPYDDPLYDAVHDAWLLAQVDYTLSGIEEQTDLFLQIGSDGLNNFSSTPSDPNNFMEPSLLTSAVFGATSDPALNASSQRQLSSLTPDASISVGGVVENANFNGDSVVDGRDFLILQRGFGLTGANPEQGDANGDGQVNGLDLEIWEQQYGGAGQVAMEATVPEPVTCRLLAIALVLFSCQSRQLLSRF